MRYKLLLFLFVLTTESLLAQDCASIFSDSSTLQMTLEYPFDELNSDIGQYPAYHSVILRYVDGEGRIFTINAEAKARGLFRKKASNCSQPPLLIKFQEVEVVGTIFQNLEKVKLVVPCMHSDYYNQLVVKEYLVYKLYNLITPYSYRVRLVNLKLVDEFSNKSYTAYAFLIEPKELLAQRLNGVILNKKNYHPNACNKERTTIMSLFQLMVGHTDWSIKALHNITLLEPEPYAPPIPIPYDFDFCGFVNAPYALPAEHLPINSVKERYFNGYCRTKEEFYSAFGLFFDKRQEMLSIIDSSIELNKKQKREVKKYIEGFYKILNNPNLVKSKILKACRTD
ncbi:MAG: hypothetical protein H6537_01110 [Bacteroidales bacterium]|nr:hypothetical protein [Bacteroidales bacterium]